MTDPTVGAADDLIDATGRAPIEFPAPAPLTSHGPARVISMVNQKGGVGKTTTTVSLGAALAEYGRRVLLVDFDPQGALSAALGVRPHELERTVYDVIMDRDVQVKDVLVHSAVPGLDLLPCNIDLSAAEMYLVNEVGREHVLSRALKPLLPEYDLVLIDCQPSLGLLTVNALAASQGFIVPLECEFFALRGLALLMQTVDKVRDRINPDVSLLGIVATMFDGRTMHSREVVTRLVDTFGDQVFHTVIARTVKFPESTVVGEPITTYSPSSAGANAYRTLARELTVKLSAAEAAADPA